MRRPRISDVPTRTKDLLCWGEEAQWLTGEPPGGYRSLQPYFLQEGQSTPTEDISGMAHGPKPMTRALLTQLPTDWAPQAQPRAAMVSPQNPPGLIYPLPTAQKWGGSRASWVKTGLSCIEATPAATHTPAAMTPTWAQRFTAPPPSLPGKRSRQTFLPKEAPVYLRRKMVLRLRWVNFSQKTGLAKKSSTDEI